LTLWIKDIPCNIIKLPFESNTCQSTTTFSPCAAVKK
jgi:hypothetical protein